MTSTRSASGKFTRHSRLKKRREFRVVLDNGRSRMGRTAVVYAHLSAASQHRLGLIISRRVGSAVVRNRLKRVARELFRQHRNEFKARAPLDFVVIAKRRAADMPRQMPADLLHTLQMLVHQLARS